MRSDGSPQSRTIGLKEGPQGLQSQVPISPRSLDAEVCLTANLTAWSPMQHRPTAHQRDEHQAKMQCVLPFGNPFQAEITASNTMRKSELRKISASAVGTIIASIRSI